MNLQSDIAELMERIQHSAVPPGTSNGGNGGNGHGNGNGHGHAHHGAPVPAMPALAGGDLPPVPAFPALSPMTDYDSVPLAEAATMVPRAKEKLEVSSEIPGILRPMFRNQGGFNNILAEACNRLVENSHQLAHENALLRQRLDSLTDYLADQNAWLNTLARDRATEHHWMHAAQTQFGYFREEIGHLREQGEQWSHEFGGFNRLQARVEKLDTQCGEYAGTLARIEAQSEQDHAWMQNLQAHVDEQAARDTGLEVRIERKVREGHADLTRLMEAGHNELARVMADGQQHLEAAQREVETAQRQVEEGQRQLTAAAEEGRAYLESHAEEQIRICGEAAKRLDRHDEQIIEIQRLGTRHAEHLQTHDFRLDQTGGHVNRLQATCEERHQHLCEVHGHLDGLGAHLGVVEERVTHLGERLNDVQTQAAHQGNHLVGLQTHVDRQVERIDGLQGQADHLAGLQAYVDRTVEQVNGLQTQASDQGNHLQGLQAHVDRQVERIDGLQPHVEATASQLAALHTQADDQGKHLTGLQAHVDRQVERIDGLQSQSERQTDRVHELETHVDHHGDHLDSLRVQVDRHLEQFTALQTQAAQQGTHLTGLQAHVDGQVTRIDELYMHSQQQGERLNNFQARADVQSERLGAFQAKFDHVDDHINGVEKSVAQQSGYVAGLQSHSDQLTRDLGTLQASTDRVVARLNDTQAHTDRADSHLHSLQTHADHLGDQFRELQKHTDYVGEHFDRIEEVVSRQGNHLNDLQSHADRLGTHLTDLQTHTDRQTGHVETLQTRVDEAADQYTQARGEFELASSRQQLLEELARRVDERQVNDASYLRAQMGFHQRLISQFLTPPALPAPEPPTAAVHSVHEVQPVHSVHEPAPLPQQPSPTDDLTPPPVSPEQADVIARRKAAAMLTDHEVDALYLAFEDAMRGKRSEIKERLSYYLPYLSAPHIGKPDSPVLDLGCGRGEWLELLRENGFSASGVDLNTCMIDQCRARKLDVTFANVIDHLASLDDASCGAVTAFHLIEHLPFRVLVQFFNECRRVLQPGGVAIFETPNPTNVLVGSCFFYHDYTHERPLPPLSTRFLVEHVGFVKVEVVPLHPWSEEGMVHGDGTNPGLVARFNELLYGPQDYAIVARTPGPWRS